MKYNSDTDMIQIYSENKWTDWKAAGLQFDGILYNAGIFNDNYFSSDYILTAGSGTTFEPTDANGITIKTSAAGANKSGLVCFTTPIDVSRYTVLNIDIKVSYTTSSAPGSGMLGFGLTTDITSTSSLINTLNVGNSTSVTTKQLDVTDYDEIYLYIYNYQNSASSSYTRKQVISKIYLATL